MSSERIGGRQKGTPNKERESLSLKAKQLNIDPFEVLLLFAKGDWKKLGYKSEKYVASEGRGCTSHRYHIDPSVRAKCASEATQYLFAKRKQVEIETGPEGLNVNLGKVDPKIINDLIEATSCLSELKKY